MSWGKTFSLHGNRSGFVKHMSPNITKKGFKWLPLESRYDNPSKKQKHHSNQNFKVGEFVSNRKGIYQQRFF